MAVTRGPEKGGWIYIMASRPNGILYVGVTADLVRRISQHRAGEVPGFTQKYDVKRLVYFERFDMITGAISREKVIKHWTRAQKVRAILERNFAWTDLYDGIV